MTEKKRILITGATGNIGVALCEYLVTKNHNLVITSRSKQSLDQLSSSLESNSDVSVIPVTSDFGESDSFHPLYQICEVGLDGLVLMLPKIEQTTDCLPPNSHWSNVFTKCFIGPLALIRGLIPIFKKNERSKVVIVSGISSTQVLSHYAINNAIRAAWVAQAKTLAFSFGPDKIHFNTLSLGGVMTNEFIHKLQEEAVEKNISYADILSGRVDNVPLRKYASQLEVAQIIEGLLSNFSNHLTGSNIICDGGFTRAY